MRFTCKEFHYTPLGAFGGPCVGLMSTNDPSRKLIHPTLPQKVRRLSALLTFFFGGVPLLNRQKKIGYPYSNLSTGGPSSCSGPVPKRRGIKAYAPGTAWASSRKARVTRRGRSRWWSQWNCCRVLYTPWLLCATCSVSKHWAFCLTGFSLCFSTGPEKHFLRPVNSAASVRNHTLFVSNLCFFLFVLLGVLFKFKLFGAKDE